MLRAEGVQGRRDGNSNQLETPNIGSKIVLGKQCRTSCWEKNWKSGKLEKFIRGFPPEYIFFKFSSFPVFQFSDIRETSVTHHRRKTNTTCGLWPPKNWKTGKVACHNLTLMLSPPPPAS
jgi:hypothetical protein